MSLYKLLMADDWLHLNNVTGYSHFSLFSGLGKALGLLCTCVCVCVSGQQLQIKTTMTWSFGMPFQMVRID